MQPLDAKELQEVVQLINFIREKNVSDEIIKDLDYYENLIDDKKITKMDIRYLRGLKKRLP
tara:strand:- start:181 stop:363 length:183 start_codon:yes stop_codon:yes gene_type:complete